MTSSCLKLVCNSVTSWTVFGTQRDDCRIELNYMQGQTKKGIHIRLWMKIYGDLISVGIKIFYPA